MKSVFVAIAALVLLSGCATSPGASHSGRQVANQVISQQHGTVVSARAVALDPSAKKASSGTRVLAAIAGGVVGLAAGDGASQALFALVGGFAGVKAADALAGEPELTGTELVISLTQTGKTLQVVQPGVTKELFAGTRVLVLTTQEGVTVVPVNNL